MFAAVVTGASGGIGGALAREIALATETKVAVHLVLVGRNKGKLEAVRSSLACPTTLVVADLSVDDDVEKLAAHCHELAMPLTLLCLAHGEFLWDTDDQFRDVDEARTRLVAANYSSRVRTIEVLLPLLRQGESLRRTSSALAGHVPRTEIFVVGSQAGAPGFVEAIEAKEGKGAADAELGYIESMQLMRAAVASAGKRERRKEVEIEKGAGSSSGGDGDDDGNNDGGGGGGGGGYCSNDVVDDDDEVWITLTEPSLVATASAKKQFAHIVGDDWSAIASPDDFARSAIVGVTEAERVSWFTRQVRVLEARVARK